MSSKPPVCVASHSIGKNDILRTVKLREGYGFRVIVMLERIPGIC